MDIKTNVYLITKPGSLKAVADVCIGGAFVAKGLRVIEGENGTFVAMPSRNAGDKYEDTFFPVTKEAREQLYKSVLDTYEQKLSQREE